MSEQGSPGANDFFSRLQNKGTRRDLLKWGGAALGAAVTGTAGGSGLLGRITAPVTQPIGEGAGNMATGLLNVTKRVVEAPILAAGAGLNAVEDQIDELVIGDIQTVRLEEVNEHKFPVIADSPAIETHELRVSNDVGEIRFYDKPILDPNDFTPLQEDQVNDHGIPGQLPGYMVFVENTYYPSYPDPGDINFGDIGIEIAGKTKEGSVWFIPAIANPDPSDHENKIIHLTPWGLPQIDNNPCYVTLNQVGGIPDPTDE